MVPSGEPASGGAGRRARAGALAALALGFAAGVAWGALEGPAGRATIAGDGSRGEARDVPSRPHLPTPPPPPLEIGVPAPPVSAAVPPGVAAEEIERLRALPLLATAPTASAFGLLRERPEEVRALAEAADALVASARLPAATGRIEGRVVAADGAPRAGVRVRAACSVNDVTDLLLAGVDAPDDLRREECALLIPLLRVASRVRVVDAVSDAEGRFSLAVLPDIEYWVESRERAVGDSCQAQATASSPSRCARVVLREAAPCALLRLRIERGVAKELEGTCVTDERLDPERERQDRRSPWRPRQSLPVERGRSDREIRYLPGGDPAQVRTVEMTVPTGTARIRAVRESGERLTSRPEVLRLRAGDVVERTLRLEETPTVRLRIIPPEGEPVEEDLHATALRWLPDLPPPTAAQVGTAEHRSNASVSAYVKPSALEEPVLLAVGEGGLAYVCVRRESEQRYSGAPLAVILPDAGAVDVEWRLPPARRRPGLDVSVLLPSGEPAEDATIDASPGRATRSQVAPATWRLELEEGAMRAWREGRTRLTLRVAIPRAAPPAPPTDEDDEEPAPEGEQRRHEVDIPPQEGDRVTVRLPPTSPASIVLEGEPAGPPRPSLRVDVVDGADLSDATTRWTIASWSGWQHGRTLTVDDLSAGTHLALAVLVSPAAADADPAEGGPPPPDPVPADVVVHDMPVAWAAFTTAPGRAAAVTLRLPALHSLEVRALRRGAVSVTPARDQYDELPHAVDPSGEAGPARLTWAWLPAGIYRVRFGPTGAACEDGETSRLVRVPEESSIEVGGAP